MDNFLNQLKPSDYIQIITALISFIISIVSIFIAIASLRQTNKITKEANRPDVVIYLQCTQTQNIQHKYLVIKNFGKTSAIIKNICCSREVDFCRGLNPFENLINNTLAPGQSLCTICDFKNNDNSFSCNIDYKNGLDNYSGSFLLNPRFTKGLLYSNNTSSHLSTLEKTIINSTEQIIKSHF
ncbi:MULTISPECIES: hypothetical protein [Clostridium]|uniref:hypothetical protein n=1 Tax=Clostridium TaxID=1485 RepID=UPI0007733DDE|nr:MULTISPECIES: hypothetical protein [Clostridium]AUM96335.1 hypothetical protein RSJ11_14750 [Clostridium sporogenes]AVQ53790.1 hypothetical protein C7M59_13350 [Clostridium botulinum]